MNTDVIALIDSLINFCQKALEIPIQLYTRGLEICPWVAQWIEYFKAEYNINILSVIPAMQEAINELSEITKMIG